jgi:hypothetical protein
MPTLSRPPLLVVTKRPVDLEGAVEIVGVFTTSRAAVSACKGAGTYLLAWVEPDKIYTGKPLDAELLIIEA